MNDNVALAVPMVAVITYVPFAIRLGMRIFGEGLFGYNHMYPREANLDQVFEKQPALVNLCKRCAACHANGFEVSLHTIDY